jgi:hypothetical protein
VHASCAGTNTNLDTTRVVATGGAAGSGGAGGTGTTTNGGAGAAGRAGEDGYVKVETY